MLTNAKEVKTDFLEERLTQNKVTKKYLGTQLLLVAINCKDGEGMHLRRVLSSSGTATENEELKFVETVRTCGEGGQPLSKVDFRQIMKHYFMKYWLVRVPILILAIDTYSTYWYSFTRK